MPDNFHTTFHWINNLPSGRLTTMPCPSSQAANAELELQAWREAGVDIVVSMLPLGEAMLLGLANEATLCQDYGMEFHNLVVTDMETPISSHNVLELITYLLEQLAADKSIAIHCRMGIGRASVLAACILVAQGNSVDEAFSRIRHARGLAVPDRPAQVTWVENLAPQLQKLQT